LTHGRIVQPKEPVALLSDGRYGTFQMAEVAVSRQMFADILSLISRLRAPRARAGKASRFGAPVPPGARFVPLLETPGGFVVAHTAQKVRFWP
jgi:hypothetical protein